MTNRLTTEQKTCIEMNMQQFQERISKIVMEVRQANERGNDDGGSSRKRTNYACR